MKRFLLSLLLPTVALAQSPNLNIGVTFLDLLNYQQTAEKGAASGYAPLNSGTMVPGAYLFPGFDAAGDGTLWVKSGTTFSALSGYTFSSTSFISNTIKIGLLSGSIYGIGETNSSRALVLQGGSSVNRVYVGNGQTIGGANSGYSAFLWSIGPSGSFSLAAGSFNGDVDLGGNDINEAGEIEFQIGTTFDGETITLPSNTSLSVSTSAGYGLLVPDTTTSTNIDLALNRDSANIIYSRLGSNNAFTGSNSFQAISVTSLSLSSALPVASGGTGGTTQATARSGLGLVLGTDVQVFNQNLKDIADLGSPASNAFLVGNGTTWIAVTGSTARAAIGLTEPVVTALSTSLTGTSTAVDPGDYTAINISSNSTTASARIFTVSSGTTIPKWINIVYTGTGVTTCRLEDSGNAKLSAVWEPQEGDSISLRWTGVYWAETSRSDN